MKLPFTSEQFFDVFEKYNLSVWPMQVVLLCMAMLSVVCLFRCKLQWQRVMFFSLGLLWLWMGIVYHIMFFSAINKAAWIFGFAFAVQGILFVYFGAVKTSMEVRFTLNLSGIVGVVVILYALVLYPFLGYTFGHLFPRAPTFGVPCPSTIFTLGVLLFLSRRPPWYIVVIPILWSAVGLAAAINLSIKEDYGLAIAGLATTIMVFFDKEKSATAPSTSG